MSGERFFKYGIVVLGFLFVFLSLLLVVDESKFEKTIMNLRKENLSFDKLEISKFNCFVKDNFLNIEMEIKSLSSEKIYAPSIVFFLLDKNGKVVYSGKKMVRPLLNGGDRCVVIIRTPHLEADSIKFYFVDMDGKPINCKLNKVYESDYNH